MALSRMQIDAYEADGIVHPLRGLEPDEARAFIPAQQDLEARLRAGWNLPQYPKAHLLAGWAWDLVIRPSIVDAVASIIGPDVVCWCATFFAKPPHDPGYVGWHQDATYWGLDPVEKVVTVWLGLTESTPANGCMQYVPGSHRRGPRPHAQRIDDANLLQSGQFVRLSADDDTIADVVLDRRRGARRRRILDPPRPDPARLAAEHVGSAADRLFDQLRRGRRPPDLGAGFRDSRSRPRPRQLPPRIPTGRRLLAGRGRGLAGRPRIPERPRPQRKARVRGGLREPFPAPGPGACISAGRQRTARVGFPVPVDTM